VATPQRRAGIIYVQVDGQQLDAKGSWSYNLGLPKRDAVVGADRVHGFKETPQVAFIEGEITDRNDVDLAKLMSIEDGTVTLELANGKVVVLRNGWFAGEGTAQTEEANVAVRFEGLSAEELT
jgi:hypothetical protein